jgi:vWA-MoxR associated protein C-terminal domain/vWA-MoxR associated protein middle region (VMAP-M) 1/Effector-associated domain 1
MGLHGRAMKKIVAALVSAFPTREKLVMMLRYEFSMSEAEVSNDSDYPYVVFKLVEKFESEGKLIKLIQGANKNNSGNPDLKYVNTIIVPIIGLSQIIAPLEEKHIEEMKQAYKVCYNQDFHLEIDDEHHFPTKFSEILGYLEDMSQGDDIYSPIQKFLAHFLVNAKIPPQIASELKKWGENNGNKFADLFKEIKEIKNQENKQPVPTYLIILLKPSLQNSSKKQYKRYSVEAWFIRDGRYDKFNYQTGEGYIPITLESKNTFSVQEIPDVLKEFIYQICEESNFSRHQTTIEFFLPNELLSEPIDSWEIQVDEESFPSPLGSEFKVIVRSYKRLQRYIYKNDWEQKWKNLLQRTCSECFFCGDGYSSGKELYGKLNANQETALALKLVKSRLYPEIFTAIYQSAIPVALWVREELPNIDVDCEIDKLLENSITELPERVQKKRSEGFSEDNISHIGQHISLLWENPYILPPSIEYTAI